MGIGSSLKKAIRKVIPNELSEVAVAAAPFVAPFNPAIAAAMSGIGSFDKTGRIGSSLKSAGKTYLGGQVARGIGGADPQWGFGGTPEGGIGSYFTSPFTGQATFGPERGSFFRGEGSIFGDLPAGPGETAFESTISPVDPRADVYGDIEGYRSAYKPEGLDPWVQKFGDPDKIPSDSFSGSKYNLFNPETGEIDPMKRDMLLSGTEQTGLNTSTNDMVNTMSGPDAGAGEINNNVRTMKEYWTDIKEAPWGEKLKIAEQFAKEYPRTLQLFGGSLAALAQWMENEAIKDDRIDLELGAAPGYMTADRGTSPVFTNPNLSIGQYVKDGGIIGLANGGEPTMEMDYRGGGFIPVGAQERADDVPARLSKNEFVMTADAVRAAGGGSVDVGAQRMYDLMNRLEAVA